MASPFFGWTSSELYEMPMASPDLPRPVKPRLSLTSVLSVVDIVLRGGTEDEAYE